MGKAIPNAEVLVVREDGSLCAAGRAGRAWCTAARWYPWDTGTTRKKPRSVSSPLPTRQSGLPIPELAVWSGDTVRMDEEGFLYFIGRRDEMIKTSGYRVSPTEIEEVIYATELVGEAAAVGVSASGARPGYRLDRYSRGRGATLTRTHCYQPASFISLLLCCRAGSSAGKATCRATPTVKSIANCLPRSFRIPSWSLRMSNIRPKHASMDQFPAA